MSAYVLAYTIVRKEGLKAQASLGHYFTGYSTWENCRGEKRDKKSLRQSSAVVLSGAYHKKRNCRTRREEEKDYLNVAFFRDDALKRSCSTSGCPANVRERAAHSSVPSKHAKAKGRRFGAAVGKRRARTSPGQQHLDQRTPNPNGRRIPIPPQCRGTSQVASQSRKPLGGIVRPGEAFPQCLPSRESN